MQVGMGLSGMADTYEYQERIERDGGERVGGHAVDFALQVDRNNGHTGSKASHRFPVFRCAKAHLMRSFFGRELPTLARHLADHILMFYVCRPDLPVNASPPWSPPTYAASPDSQYAYKTCGRRETRGSVRGSYHP